MNPLHAPPVVETDVDLRPYNSFALPARARRLIRLRSEADLRWVINHPEWGPVPKFILGGGSNLVLTRDVQALVLKVEVLGRRLWDDGDSWVVEGGAGECWHDFVQWTLQQGAPGLENLSLIPGTVGAAPVQNIGAYGVEVQDRFESLDTVDLMTGRTVTLDRAGCRFGYRDSVFKQHLKDRSVILRVRFRLPKSWRPELGYLDLQRAAEQAGVAEPTAQQVADWVCAIRRAKLPDPAQIGNAGSFFKNPVVSEAVCREVIARDPHLVHYALPDGRYKLAAGWLIDACGWKGKSIGGAGVYEKQALVLVNRGDARGGEVLTLAQAIQASVLARFGVVLEAEPVVV
ncbi:UDP-N-acetylmuramate dehydrogenase [Inhella gelatinilytica]|uniref:UDP-N-acetylenolpyruvoylglucosamine reductase n=1 Tax=Inhella gelatinilytica TaxID=2795030 RepID=A0A931NDN2_9BURK|nr:UDP-N-acetylmuramate dehydrogenase [Inhella gelatinilytica]MBH9552799.1 UDP-N-acetylmuramate dehydrogenase [Inhella gelatinilytica]